MTTIRIFTAGTVDLEQKTSFCMTISKQYKGLTPPIYGN